ncbi:MAG: hypothetical protein Q7T50_07820 [Candidatus Magasanikbacteria bacterium]|nr:hypothetical protein [Candidatus Magasanikbacteria bacterium]
MNFNINKKYIFRNFFVVLFALVALFLNTSEVLAIDRNTGLVVAAKCGLAGNCNANNLDTTSVITSIPTAIGKVIGVGLSFLGIIFMLLIIYGGFMWMFSRGNDQAVSKAKEVIKTATIGLVIVLSAYAITSFISTSL